MNEQEFAELSAAGALHALSPDDQRRLRAALTVHPEWREIARADAETAAALSSPVEPEAPPSGIRAVLLDAIAQTSQHERTDDGAHPARSVDASTTGASGHAEDAHAPAQTAPDATAAHDSWSATVRTTPASGGRKRLRILYALAACIVLLVGIGVGAAAVTAYLNRPAAVVALEQIEQSGDAQQATVALADGGSATAHWSASLGRAVLVTEGIAEPTHGQTYELWFVRGDAPVSAGTFAADGGNATAELDGKMQQGDAIAVTVEPAGGSPTGAPTSEPIIVIPTV